MVPVLFRPQSSNTNRPGSAMDQADCSAGDPAVRQTGDPLAVQVEVGAAAGFARREGDRPIQRLVTRAADSLRDGAVDERDHWCPPLVTRTARKRDPSAPCLMIRPAPRRRPSPSSSAGTSASTSRNVGGARSIVGEVHPQGEAISRSAVGLDHQSAVDEAALETLRRVTVERVELRVLEVDDQGIVKSSWAAPTLGYMTTESAEQTARRVVLRIVTSRTRRTG